tara:strand:+ start:6521 stop:7351 length:831 start_codon:yes stop_codon:yes gene_type:complete
MIYIRLTNGFGNNLFQYNAACVLARFHNTEVLAMPPYRDYYAIECLGKIGVKFGDPNHSDLKSVNGDKEYVQSFNKKLHGQDILLSGYFEDYRFYLSSRESLMSNFPDVKKRSDKDLVFHLRTGDRLFMKNEFFLKPKPEDYISAINNFKFNRLHIVTDLPKWETVTKDKLSKMRFHINVPNSESVPIEHSVSYLNSLIEALEVFNPIVQRRSVGEDFNFIRTFDNILFEHGTMSWWAAFLSKATKVGVYGPWRPWKEASNKNLSSVPLNNWFKWK